MTRYFKGLNLYQFTYIHFEDSSPTDLQTVRRHTVLRALCARAAKSIRMSTCLSVCLFV